MTERRKPRSISELTKEEKDALKSITNSSGWDVMESILLGIQKMYEGDIKEMERDIMEGDNAKRVGVMRGVIDICDTILSIPTDIATTKNSSIEKDLEVY